MDGGTCNSTAFAAYNYDSAGICLALGNYHNMKVEGAPDGNPGFLVSKSKARASAPPTIPTAGPGIASETIHTEDFANLVKLLAAIAPRIHTYKPGWSPIKKRLSTMHRKEQKALLYARI